MTQDDAFTELLKSFRDSLFVWDYFVNWDKVLENANALRSSLDEFDVLIGTNDFDSAFINLLEKNPKLNELIPTLTVRDGQNRSTFSIIDNLYGRSLEVSNFDFSKPASTHQSRVKALEFVEKSGLKRLFQSGMISSTSNYVVGVEAGLDSNGRKNRSGNSMETVAEGLIATAVQGTGYTYIAQANAGAIADRWGIKFEIDNPKRCFDFAVSNGKRLILIEVNFYSSGGSKLKTVAGEFTDLFLRYFQKTNTVEFVWITDGAGWNTAKAPLRNAVHHLDNVMSIDWLKQGALHDLISAK